MRLDGKLLGVVYDVYLVIRLGGRHIKVFLELLHLGDSESSLVGRFFQNTNVDKATEYIKRADFESGNYIKCWSAGSWTNNHWQYNTWVQLTKVDNTTIRVNNGYNDGNWQGGLVAVYGFAYKNS